MFRIGILPPQHTFQEDIIIIIIIIIIITDKNKQKSRETNKRGCGGVIPTLNMLVIFMNRKILNQYKQTEKFFPKGNPV